MAMKPPSGVPLYLLIIFTFSSCFRLLLTFYAWLLVMLSFTDFAQLLLNLRKALSKVSFSFTITFDMLSHLTSLQPYYCVPDCSGILNCTPKIISDILNTSTVFCIFFYFFVLYAKLQLILQYFSYFCNCLIYSCRILTACLSHVRTTATAATYKSRNALDQIACMRALCHCFICSHCD